MHKAILAKQVIGWDDESAIKSLQVHITLARKLGANIVCKNAIYRLVRGE